MFPILSQLNFRRGFIPALSPSSFHLFIVDLNIWRSTIERLDHRFYLNWKVGFNVFHAQFREFSLILISFLDFSLKKWTNIN